MILSGMIDGVYKEVDLDFYKKEIISLVAICLDAETDEKTRIILRADLKKIQSEFNKMIAEME